MNRYICIVCPKSCEVAVQDVDGTLDITGHGCKRGIEYAQNEHLAPKRMLTTTVKVMGGQFRRLGVVGSAEVPKDRLRACLAEAYRAQVRAPVRAGDVVLANVAGTGCNLLAAMTVEAAKP